MKKLDEHSQWDEEWAKAFEDASQTPPPGVWSNIHAVQANKEADKFRKKAVYYKWLAAASVFISICSAALLLLNSDLTNQKDGVAETAASKEQLLVKPQGGDSATNSLAEESSISTVVENEEQSVLNAPPAKEEEGNARRKHSARGAKAESNQESKNSVSSIASASANASRLAPKSGTTVSEQPELERDSDLPLSQDKGSLADADAGLGQREEDSSASPAMLAINENREEQNSAGEGTIENSGDGKQAEIIELVSISKKDLVALADGRKSTKVEAEVRKVWVASNFLKKDKLKSVPRYMLGATLASNNFSANYQDQNPEIASFAESSNDFQYNKLSPLSNARVTDWDEEQKSVMSLAGGLQAAAWLGKRWVLQGGVQYGNYKTGSKASTFTDASGNNSYPLHFSNYSEEKVQTTSFARGSRSAGTVSAINSFEFLSVPLSIGYVVIDRRISLLLAPGLSSEFFLSNTISADEGRSDLNSYTVSNGEESPFSFVHFKGLLSAQLFYRMSDRYIISLEPGYQQAITDFNKSDSFFNSRPSNLSLAAGFRYVFH